MVKDAEKVEVSCEFLLAFFSLSDRWWTHLWGEQRRSRCHSLKLLWNSFASCPAGKSRKRVFVLREDLFPASNQRETSNLVGELHMLLQDNKVFSSLSCSFGPWKEPTSWNRKRGTYCSFRGWLATSDTRIRSLRDKGWASGSKNKFQFRMVFCWFLW